MRATAPAYSTIQFHSVVLFYSSQRCERSRACSQSANTYRPHLLFLPAAGSQYANYGTVGCYLCTNTSAGDARSNYFVHNGLSLAISWWRRGASRAVRLASVVSGLPNIPKSFSNTCSNHLLFLPVAGNAWWPYTFDMSFGNYVSITSVMSNDSRMGPRLVRFGISTFNAFYASWVTRFNRNSVRLCSVVSGLTVTRKSISNTYFGFHLLFLPAAGCIGPYGNQPEYVFLESISAVSAGEASYWIVSPSAFRPLTYGRWTKYSVRLVSVVSELTFVGKKCQSVVVFYHCITFVILSIAENLFSHFRSNPHLLFLPAASMGHPNLSSRDGGYYHSVSFNTGYFEYDLAFKIALFQARSAEWAQVCARKSVRLCSVVSELTHDPKSFSNTYSNHLLFLPAASRFSGTKQEFPRAGWYYAVDGGRRFVLADGEVAIAVEPRHIRESIRLASVVSDLTHVPKSISTTYRPYLLFLPAAGWRRANTISSVGNNVDSSVSTATSGSYRYRVTFGRTWCDIAGSIERDYGQSVRLASVVSGLPNIPKSFSNTCSNHLLFLPASGRRHGSGISKLDNCILWSTVWKDYALGVIANPTRVSARYTIEVQDGAAVRLVSVVSGLPHVAKSISNTYFGNHLLFLPAEPLRYFYGQNWSSDSTVGYHATRGRTDTVSPCVHWTVIDFGISDSFWQRRSAKSVRLVSVVSGLPHVAKSISNTYFGNHLLFLPAAGYRYAISVAHQDWALWAAAGGVKYSIYQPGASATTASQARSEVSGRSVRLASVVSELAFTPKSLSSAYCHHLLFLPVAGLLYASGSLWYFSAEAIQQTCTASSPGGSYIVRLGTGQIEWQFPRERRSAVRLASVVSGLPFAQKSRSNIHSNHLLFLPAANVREGVKTQYTDCVGYGYVNKGGRTCWVSTDKFHVLFDYFGNSVGKSVRLASVVSELPCVPKSHSKTCPSHLLFLPPVNYRLGNEFKYPNVLWYFSSNYAFGLYAHEADFRLRSWRVVAGQAVRLASVVSGLPHVAKSISNTYFGNHLLFLPAAGLREDQGLLYVDSWGCYMLQSKLGMIPQLFFSASRITPGLNYSRLACGAVRLVSVVSGLAVTWKSISNAYCSHLLFLPAAGYRNGNSFSASGTTGTYFSPEAASASAASLFAVNSTAIYTASGWPSRSAGLSIRLASVVSGLSFAQKSRSNIHSNHLLFLPAAGWRNNLDIGSGGTGDYWSDSQINSTKAARVSISKTGFDCVSALDRKYARSVRLVSVVSGLAFTKKSDSKTYLFHLLFLPAAGNANASGASGTGQSAFLWSIKQNTSHQPYYTRIIGVKLNASFDLTYRDAFSRCAVRLVSVVSELAIAPKSRSNIHSNHLLFLPPSALRVGSGFQYEQCGFYWRTRSWRFDFAPWEFISRDQEYSRASGQSVRLASVVSESAVAQKSISTTYRFHLLFLPAARYIDSASFGRADGGFYNTSSSRTAVFAWSFAFHPQRFDGGSGQDGARQRMLSVRLCSVVSGLTFTPKSHSNTCLYHLLFLPAADCREAVRFNTPKGGFYQVTGISPSHIQFGTSSISTTGGWPHWPAMSVRLVSVVSALTFAPKFHSNKCSSHLLFLPAAGWFYLSNGQWDWEYNVGLWGNVASSDTTTIQINFKDFIQQFRSYNRFARSAVRLCSVVSESAFIQKSFSNTHSNHLLFLPAAGTSRSDNLGAYFSIIGSAGDVATFLFSAKSYYCTHGAQLARAWHRSVRLVSVVSELTFTQKSISSTYFFHLLFLPEASGRVGMEFGLAVTSWLGRVHPSSSGLIPMFADDRFALMTFVGQVGQSVRLVSVVSELTITSNSLLNTYLSYLLFLPAAGGSDSTGYVGFDYQARYWSAKLAIVFVRDGRLDIVDYSALRANPVRLASVVSGLTFVSKSISSTYRYHFLFLPAAGRAFRTDHEYVGSDGDYHFCTGASSSVQCLRLNFSAEALVPATQPYWARLQRNSVRSCSVVSDLTSIQKTISNTYPSSNHFLFLPAAGVNYAAIGSFVCYVSTTAYSASELLSAFANETTIMSRCQWWTRDNPRSVRLVSVVSGLTVCQKSISNTYCSHLLFLPAAGHRNRLAIDFSQSACISATAGPSGFTLWRVYIVNSSIAIYGGWTRDLCGPVRLVSVVSELTSAPKSLSNTFWFHLLFLPAAGYRYNGNGYSREGMWVSWLTSTGRYALYTPDMGSTASRQFYTVVAGHSLRLASVVSGLTFTKKSDSKTYLFHLLFLPAAGRRKYSEFDAVGTDLFYRLSISSTFVRASSTSCGFPIIGNLDTWGLSVRLASVVSGLTIAPKFRSNTNRSHLLFLPAAGLRDVNNNGSARMDGICAFYWTAVLSGPGSAAYFFYNPEAQDIKLCVNLRPTYTCLSVRLVSVVSELTRAPKSSLNTFCCHLLFLPAAGCISVRYGFQRDQVFHYTTIASGFVNAYFMMYAAGNFKVNADARTGRLPIRLVSVVSGLTFTPKSHSNTCFYHLLFLPAGNRREGVSTPYSSAGFYAFMSDESVSLWFHGGTFNLKCATYRQWGRHVRLASVVSELTSASKSLSNTHSNHLLFLPAAGALHGTGFTRFSVLCLYATTAYQTYLVFDNATYFGTQLFGSYQFATSVRLASVVSDLSVAQKSFSNTYRYHLLFLPAAIVRHGIIWGSDVSPFPNRYHPASLGLDLQFSADGIRFDSYVATVACSVRLASVVSDLTVTRKSLSNTYRFYLLFLPAAGLARDYCGDYVAYFSVSSLGASVF